ncbi:tRNA 2'-phosphotransferase 1-like isoform X2 [Ruditapes philippinarum]|uniref:tRNA 2'-phosphotransferase 1-like isoform X2 n=1 Tax=Ruditapes philippinarum TaxID=129788 RepID=UPI00295B6353|nr:tRNA 2'-phosphotransferase 1-like isoform X2 [Ruditapes philippinarum]
MELFYILSILHRKGKEGYVNIEDILELPEARRFSVSDVEGIVNRDGKGRFGLRTRNGMKQIKATQGHTMKLDKLELTPINRHTDVRTVLHGTRKMNWQSIKTEGLSKRGRTHIHFAAGENVQSGFPPRCDMVIEIDLQKALADGYKFYKSENDVILSEGNGNGVIPPKYFKRAYDLHSHTDISLQ